jgi:UMF1 family MFS transporter
MRSSREQRAWYFYDWANSGYVTTTGTVLFGPYLTSIAKDAAGCVGDGVCDARLHLFGIPIAPGSLFFYTVTFATLFSAFLLPIVGAVVDRRGDKRKVLGAFAWIGASAACLMFFVSGQNWLLGSVLLVVANLGLGASLVVYDAILIDIAVPDDRDRVSSQGWAFGYAGGGLLLIVNLVIVMLPGTFGIDTEMAVRLSLLSAGVWWAGWTIIPFRRIIDRPSRGLPPSADSAFVSGAFRQLFETLRDLRLYRQTAIFLAAYLFFNDGVQTVISSASVYGAEQLDMSQSILIAAIVVVQIVAFGGALLFGRRAASRGAIRAIRESLVIWVVAVAVGYFLPVGGVAPFFVIAAVFGTVLGGIQALSRSLFSQMVPRGREAEYFSLYQACERGTSWLGTLTFGLVHQWTNSYRPAILSLIVFFVVGGFLLSKVDVRAGIQAAGNEVPAVV